ncbi:hypothetical protein [Trueperella sp. LYQ141]|uniref:hypothetical protein n=1 Tax=Trueperella sp. LYQ141 TaxID=3391058 RepID=UPI0039838F6A
MRTVNTTDTDILGTFNRRIIPGETVFRATVVGTPQGFASSSGTKTDVNTHISSHAAGALVSTHNPIYEMESLTDALAISHTETTAVTPMPSCAKTLDKCAALPPTKNVIATSISSRTGAFTASELPYSSTPVEIPASPSTETPVEAPAPAKAPEKPDVWEMPNEGMQWCDCGAGCEIDRETVEDELWFILEDIPEWVSHRTVCQVIQELWNYESVCNFFFDHVALSARAVYGKVAEKYPYSVAVDIVGYFSKTWNGCPEIACEGGLNWSDID